MILALILSFALVAVVVAAELVDLLTTGPGCPAARGLDL